MGCRLVPAIEGLPTYWQASNNLATVLRKSGRSQEAATLFEEVLEQVPDQPDVHLELGDLYFGPLGDRERARRHYNAFLRRAPQDPRAAGVRERLAGVGGSGRTCGGTPGVDTRGKPIDGVFFYLDNIP